MTRLLFAVATIMGLAVVPMAASPASAESVASCRGEMTYTPDGRLVDAIDYNADTYAILLRQRGYNVESIEGWGGCVKATISDAGGRSHFEFFDPDTLEPLTR